MTLIHRLHIRYVWADLRDYQWLMAMGVVAFSILDIWITQSILRLSDAHSEGNLLMAPIIMSGWAWAIRVGIPVLAVIRDIRKSNYDLLLFGFTLYAAVVCWNALHMTGTL